MLKFTTSVSWRVLRFFDAIGYLTGCTDHIITRFNHALSEWSRFLLNDAPHPGRHEQHMFLGGVIECTSIANLPPNINRYLARAIECNVAVTQDSATTYAKMGKFVLFGFVEMPHPRRWKGTKLHIRNEAFGQTDVEMPHTVLDFIFTRARRKAERYSQISPRQQERIRKSYEQNLDHAIQSKTFRALHHDVLFFGDTAFEATQPDTRNRTEKRKN